MITIIGASGQAGSKIATTLLDAGRYVRVLGRTAESLNNLGERGADIRVGNVADTPWLTETLRDSDAVFAMVPSNPFAECYGAEQDRLGESIAEALTASAVPTVVALSSLGADRPDAPGVIGALHRQELRLAKLSARVALLRPVSFFENLLVAVEQLEESGSHVDSVEADVPIPMIATADVAATAARMLTDRQWTAHVGVDLLGERDLSYDEATAILGDRLGIDDPSYVQLAYDAMIDAFTDLGISLDYARHYVDMTRAFNSGELTDGVPRTVANTTPTRIEDFASSLRTHHEHAL